MAEKALLSSREQDALEKLRRFELSTRDTQLLQSVAIASSSTVTKGV